MHSLYLLTFNIPGISLSEKSISEDLFNQLFFSFSYYLVGHSNVLYEYNWWEIHYFNPYVPKTWIHAHMSNSKWQNAYNDLQGYYYLKWKWLQSCFEYRKTISWLYFEKITLSYYGNYLGCCWNSSDEGWCCLGSGR